MKRPAAASGLFLPPSGFDPGKTFDIYFVPAAEFGKGKHANELIYSTAPFWTCTRIYMPGRSVLDKQYKLPELKAACHTSKTTASFIASF